MQPHEPLVRKWLLALIACGACNLSADETAARLGAITPILADLFAPDLFNRRTLAAAAARIRFFPTVADVAEVLRDWAKAERAKACFAAWGFQEILAEAGAPHTASSTAP